MSWEMLADAARAFDESALRSNDDNAKPMPVRKWTAPVRLGCFARAWWDKDRAIYRGELRINPTRLHDSDRCAVHEAMHSFGFLSHPHAAMSVLSYVQHGQRSLTPLDQQLIRTLYDSRLTVGMPPAAASPLACRILGERMSVAAGDIEAVCRDRRGPTPSI